MSYKDPDWLHEQYHDKGLSLEQVGDKCGVTAQTIHNWMKRHDIPRRKAKSLLPPHYRTNESGYEEIVTEVDGSTLKIYVHRLASVAWFGFDKVVGNEVHHRNNNQWDNRFDNIEVMSKSDHTNLTINESLERRKDGTFRGKQ